MEYEKQCPHQKAGRVMMLLLPRSVFHVVPCIPEEQEFYHSPLGRATLYHRVQGRCRCVFVTAPRRVRASGLWCGSVGSLPRSAGPGLVRPGCSGVWLQ